jgi:hypothetical protein
MNKLKVDIILYEIMFVRKKIKDRYLKREIDDFSKFLSEIN